MQKNFCLIVGLASQEKTGSETGKIETKLARLDVKHCTYYHSFSLKNNFREINSLSTITGKFLVSRNFCQKKKQ